MFKYFPGLLFVCLALLSGCACSPRAPGITSERKVMWDQTRPIGYKKGDAMAKLHAAECREFIQAVTEKAAEMGVPITVAIVGPEGHLIALERMDDAGFITPDTARAKAFTVAAFRSMSPRFTDGLVIQQWFKERNPQMLINAAVFTNGQVVVSGGAAPIFKSDEMVGAYGISGATSDQDEEIGRYARAKVGWAHMPEHDTTPESVKRHVNEIYAKVGLGDRKL